MGRSGHCGCGCGSGDGDELGLHYDSFSAFPRSISVCLDFQYVRSLAYFHISQSVIDQSWVFVE